MLAIRLTKIGKKGEAKYRIVVAEKRQRRDGKPVEELGHYHKYLNKEDKKINLERVNYWISKGAKLTPTARRVVES
ncbi:30S ribosomal protein S16 [Patescibacteria group bacterium]|nr:30S ribosomal protein S16 [Patescibacteria group bacterium]MCL5010336.1 30S ribosomal protein S16 [Patescibacteria group bacterium]